MGKKVIVETFIEEGYARIPTLFLSDEEYGRGLQTFVPACVDVVFADLNERKLYLAMRKSDPLPGPWWFGGRMRADETKEEAAIRCLARETGIEIDPARLHLIGIFDYFMKRRAQKPKEMGCHMLGFTFFVTPFEGELRRIRLDDKEYDVDQGVRAYSLDDLIQANAFKSVFRVYDELFSP